MRPFAYDTVGSQPPTPPFWAKPLHLAAAAMLGGAALLSGYSYWQGQHGELVIDIADQQCGSLENVRVYVDDELRCTVAPCSLSVRAGGHVVRAEVDGKPTTAAQAVFVSADLPALHKVQVGASEKTAIEVRGGPAQGELFLDGRPEGHIPRRVTGLESGEHLVQVRSPSGTVERRVSLQEEQLLVLDLPVPEPRQSEANEPRSPSDLPLRGGSHGRSNRSDDDESGSSSRQANEGENKRTTANASTAGPGGGTSNTSSSGAGKKTGTLRLTAEPSAMVLLDGKPLGHTPQRVSVTPGAHSLLFVHPTQGRTRATVKVKPGQTRNLHARF